MIGMEIVLEVQCVGVVQDINIMIHRIFVKVHISTSKYELTIDHLSILFGQ